MADTFNRMLRSGTSHKLTIIDLADPAHGPIEGLTGSFDALMIDGSLLDFFSPESESKPQRLSYFSSRQLKRFEEVVHRLIQSKTPSMLLMHHMDLHGLTSRHFDLGRVTGPMGSLELFSLFDAVAWPYESGVIDLRSIPEFIRDPWMLTNPVDALTAFKAAIPARVHLPFALSAGELRQKTLRKRWDVSIPGVPYRSRRAARKSSLESGLSTAPMARSGSMLIAAERGVSILPGRSHFTSWVHRLRRHEMRQVVSQSRVTWVDGSAFGYPVRKFFEIPAWNVPMITMGAPHLVDMGFEPERDFLLATPEDFGEAAARLLDKPMEAARISGSARQIVQRSHSSTARARDLWWVLEQFSRGNVGVARYRRGEIGME